MDSELTQIQRKIKLFLAKTASKRRTVPYSQLCKAIGLPYSMANPDHRNKLAEDLGEISREELFTYERPMLSCIVVDASTGMPGKGFFRWAEVLYDTHLHNEEERLEFIAIEMRDTHDFWSSPEGLKEIAIFEKDFLK